MRKSHTVSRVTFGVLESHLQNVQWDAFPSTLIF